ncbi:MAG: 1-acyl-sn-glycerol-3-phosphate acyltransferase, partial [Odoribacter sp.]|nr:1-acyl-sn-glycerol-3-phosphate acyltransferase [Odoribacter sp.]
MTSDSEFDSIRPYCGDEIEVAKNRLCRSQEFLNLFSQLTQMKQDSIVAALQNVRDRNEFQERFFGPIIQSLIQMTTDGVSTTGMELVQKDTAYIFMSNHRDIILDSAILNVLLRQHGNKYTRAAIGSNLLINDWVTDLVKLNSCFVIERDITVREMLTSSALRSKYIRGVIEENENSVWIAEREGRTKNGDDKAQPSLLKMLKMSGSSNFADNFKA